MMTVNDYLNSAAAATIGADSHPKTRVINRMLWDDKGMYILTAKGRAFYEQLMKRHLSLCQPLNR